MKAMIPLLLLAIFVVACEPTELETPDAGPAPADGAEPDAQPDPEETAPATEDAGEGYELFSGLGTLEYWVEYNVHTDTQGYSADSVMRQYVDAPARYRADVETQGVETRSIIEDDTVYSCTRFSGNWACQQFDF